LTLQPAPAAEVGLHVRMPEWCPHVEVRLNGVSIGRPALSDGYLVIRRKWEPGDTIDFAFEMPLRRILANPRVDVNRGHVALQRGPLIYCLEDIDNPQHVNALLLPRTSHLRTAEQPDLLGGVTSITGQGLTVEAHPWRNRLYRPAPTVTTCSFQAVPYYAWNNRGQGDMAVWIPECPGLTQPLPDPEITATASHCYASDTVVALHDEKEPVDSRDSTVPRFTWWNKRGTTEWVEYTFATPRTVRAVQVYWFDDTSAGGQCRPPDSWRVLYRDGEEWKDVAHAAPYETALDTFNRVSFDPVTTSALRIEAKLKPKYSGGILEWKIIEE
jgi:hypothetical protein